MEKILKSMRGIMGPFELEGRQTSNQDSSTIAMFRGGGNAGSVEKRGANDYVLNPHRERDFLLGRGSGPLERGD